MIHGIGIDIVYIPKFRKAVERWGNRIKLRLFTDAELTYCGKRKFSEQHLAVRFAAKEAFIKAFGRVVKFRNIEVLNNPDGRPYIRLADDGPGAGFNLKIHVTLTHDGEYCIAHVIIHEDRHA